MGLIKNAIKEKKQRKRKEEQGTLERGQVHELLSLRAQGQGYQPFQDEPDGRRLLQEGHQGELRLRRAVLQPAQDLRQGALLRLLRHPRSCRPRSLSNWPCWGEGGPIQEIHYQ